MRTLLILLKREIEDHFVDFLVAVGVTALLIILAVSAAYRGEEGEIPVYSGVLSLPLIVLLIVGFSGIGGNQMYADRTRKTSAFLSTLPTTRGQILAAKIIMGVLAVLIVIVPLYVTAEVLWRRVMPAMPVHSGLVFNVFAVVFLMCFACYCLGLLIGRTSNRAILTLGSILLTFVLAPLIVVKGFGYQANIILVLFIGASLVRTWRKFMSTSL
ncbi:MAG: ABC transporter permease subunit [Phycisphaerales bacterium]|nr:MAG: ABC transporter permease subunit [Phycisphaerales bacterium]